MSSIYILARDHLERAASILSGTDAQSQEIRLMVERTIELMYEVELRGRDKARNVVDFQAARFARGREAARVAE